MPAKEYPIPPSVISDGRRQYHVNEELGKGGFAACYKAQQQGKSPAVAVKVVKTELSRAVEGKFLVEIQIHSKIRHKHVVGFDRAFTDGPLTYVVLELCPLGSMKELQARRKTLSSPEIRRLVAQICSGLSFIHSRSVIHRDLKLANIFLDADMNPKLGDFGLAAPLLTDEEGSEIRRRTLCGTPNYIAPEVLNQDQGHAREADIWGMGILLFVLYNASMPFSNKKTKTQKDILDNVKKSQYKWPAESLTRVPLAAQDLVDAILVRTEASRLTLDDMMAHPFFSQGDIPKHLKHCDRTAPSWLTSTEPKEIRLASMKTTLSALLSESGFVPNSSSPKKSDSVYHEFLQEEKDMRIPSLPLTSIYTYQPAPPKSSKSSLSTLSNSSLSAAHRATLTSPLIAKDEETLPRLRLTAHGLCTAHLDPLLAQLSAYLTRTTSAYAWPGGTSAFPAAVIQWVDYTKKYGLGVILSSGAIAALYVNSTPATAVMAHGVVPHYLSGQGRAQYLPEGTSVEFFERSATGTSLRRRSELGSAYRVLDDGKALGGDEFRNARCSKMHTWSRFAGYMTNRLSASARAQMRTYGEEEGEETRLPVVYQRLGNVHVWVWEGCATQWEFADHLKVLLSGDANLVKFWTEAGVWEFPMRVVMGASESRNKEVWDLVVGCKVVERLRFVKSVLAVWKREGKVGAAGKEKLLWEGEGKLDWFTKYM
ncbi:MAG: Cell cycle serine/threonine-protein kinase cdc5/MSD2 [Stictis urceolatum]|nr:Cell cycle serine/threonine-protein kinase cdc5/MSD2 [Stictis urceolata]